MRTIIYIVLIGVLSISILTGCGYKRNETKDEISIIVEQIPDSTSDITSDSITDNQALESIQKYCYTNNPDLEKMVDEGQYQISWSVSLSNDDKIVILYRSYTGAEVRYYINRITGDTYVTEFVSGIMDEEQRTDETFNIRDYIE